MAEQEDQPGRAQTQRVELLVSTQSGGERPAARRLSLLRVHGGVQRSLTPAGCRLSVFDCRRVLRGGGQDHYGGPRPPADQS